MINWIERKEDGIVLPPGTDYRFGNQSLPVLIQTSDKFYFGWYNYDSNEWFDASGTVPKEEVVRWCYFDDLKNWHSFEKEKPTVNAGPLLVHLLVWDTRISQPRLVVIKENKGEIILVESSGRMYEINNQMFYSHWALVVDLDADETKESEEWIVKKGVRVGMDYRRDYRRDR